MESRGWSLVATQVAPGKSTSIHEWNNTRPPKPFFGIVTNMTWRIQDWLLPPSYISKSTFATSRLQSFTRRHHKSDESTWTLALKRPKLKVTMIERKLLLLLFVRRWNENDGGTWTGRQKSLREVKSSQSKYKSERRQSDTIQKMGSLALSVAI